MGDEPPACQIIGVETGKKSVNRLPVSGSRLPGNWQLATGNSFDADYTSSAAQLIQQHIDLRVIPIPFQNHRCLIGVRFCEQIENRIGHVVQMIVQETTTFDESASGEVDRADSLRGKRSNHRARVESKICGVRVKIM